MVLAQCSWINSFILNHGKFLFLLQFLNMHLLVIANLISNCFLLGLGIGLEIAHSKPSFIVRFHFRGQNKPCLFASTCDLLLLSCQLNILSLFLLDIFILLCPGKVISCFYLFEFLYVSCIWISISLLRLGYFSAFISLKFFLKPLVYISMLISMTLKFDLLVLSRNSFMFWL